MSEDKPEAPSLPPDMVAETAQAEAPKDTIVVVEDSKPNRDILVQNFKKFGFNVVAFENGKKAWEGLPQQADKNIVAIFSDIMMPELDGMELLKLVRGDEKLKKIPFVFVSAVLQKEYIIEAAKYGINGYLLKPITASILKDKIREMFPTLNIK